MTKLLAIVPAYNEAGAIGSTVSECTCTPRASMSWWSTTAPPTTPRLRAPAGATSWSCRSTSGSAAPCSRLPVRDRTATRSRSRSTATGSTIPATRRAARGTSLGPEPQHGHGSRFLDMADSDGSAPRPRGASASGSSPASCRASSAARHRPHVGPADDRPPRHRAVRPRLPARLPRGRGDRCSSRAPHAAAGARPMRPGTGVSSIGSTQSVYYMIKVTLAVFVGLLRARPAIDAATPPPSKRSTACSHGDGPRIQLVAIVVAGGLFFIVFELVRRKRLLERYALLWLGSTSCCSAWPCGRTCSSRSSRGRGSTTRRRRCSR